MEEQIIQLIARDRLDIPLSSMHQKIHKAKKKQALSISEILGQRRYQDERVYAYVEKENNEKTRGYKEAVAEFCEEFPREGLVLMGKIAEKRIRAEEYLYFGVNPGKRLTTDDYVSVMETTGLSETVARSLYPDLINVSRKLAKAREEDRSILVGKYAVDSD